MDCSVPKLALSYTALLAVVCEADTAYPALPTPPDPLR